MGPEDYTPDYFTEVSRSEKSLLVRSLGNLFCQVFTNRSPTNQVPNSTTVQYMAALFTASEQEIDDGFATDPTQYDIGFDNAAYMKFCRDQKPLWVSPLQEYGRMSSTYVPATGLSVDTIIQGRPQYEWDTNVARRLQGDEGLILLVNSVSFHIYDEIEFTHTIDVTGRTLIQD